MKTATEWAAQHYAKYDQTGIPNLVSNIAQIQVEALRHAAQIVRETGGQNAEEHAMAIEWHGTVLLKS